MSINHIEWQFDTDMDYWEDEAGTNMRGWAFQS